MQSSRKHLINGVNYHVAAHGDGDKTVLMLHGMPDTSAVWKHQIAPLVDAGYQVITLDMLGYGETEKPQDPARYAGERVIDDLAVLLEELDVGEMDIVGHDWGAYASWELVTHLPQHFRKHVVISMGHPAVFFSDLSINVLKSNWYMYLATQPKAVDLYTADNCSFFREFIIPTHPDLNEVCARLSDPVAMQANLNWDAGNPLSVSFMVARASGLDYPKVTVPTLGIWSAGDAYLLEDHMMASNAYLDAEWEYARLDTGSHWCMLDNPAETSREILSWLSG